MKTQTPRLTTVLAVLCCTSWCAGYCLADTNTTTISRAVQISVLTAANKTYILQQSTNLNNWVKIEEIEGKGGQEIRYFTTSLPEGFFRVVETNAAVHWIAPLALTGKNIRINVENKGTWTLAFTSSSVGNDGNPSDPYSVFDYTYYRMSDSSAHVTKLHIDDWLDVFKLQFQTQTNGSLAVESYATGVFVQKGTGTFVVLP